MRYTISIKLLMIFGVIFKGIFTIPVPLITMSGKVINKFQKFERTNALLQFSYQV